MDSAAASFWQSDLFAALLTSAVTFAVGLFAFVLYRRQAIDKKKDAASIILLEIKNAEAQIAQAREVIIRDKVLPRSTFTMKTASWHNYSYLFVREFTAEEWSMVNTFYEKCRLFDETIEYNNSFYRKNEEQISINLHQFLGTYTKEYLDDFGDTFKVTDEEARVEQQKQLHEEHQDLIKAFAATLRSDAFSDDFFYQSNKAFSDGEAIVATIKSDLSTSTIGTKLEKIINQNIRSRMLDRFIG